MNNPYGSADDFVDFVAETRKLSGVILNCIHDYYKDLGPEGDLPEAKILTALGQVFIDLCVMGKMPRHMYEPMCDALKSEIERLQGK